MKVFELGAYLKGRGVRGFSTLKKTELEAKVEELQKQERAKKYEENLRDTAVCSGCLYEQRKQRKIDSKTHDQRLLEGTLRTLVCEYCKHANLARDGDDTICAYCGALQSSDAVAAVRYRQ